MAEMDEIKTNDSDEKSNNYNKALKWYQDGTERANNEERERCSALGIRLAISTQNWQMVRIFSKEYNSDWCTALDLHISSQLSETMILGLSEMRRLFDDIVNGEIHPLRGISQVVYVDGNNNFEFTRDVKKSLIQGIIEHHNRKENPILLRDDVTRIGLDRSLAIFQKWGAHQYTLETIRDEAHSIGDDAGSKMYAEYNVHISKAATLVYSEYSIEDIKELYYWFEKLKDKDKDTYGGKKVGNHLLRLLFD